MGKEFAQEIGRQSAGREYISQPQFTRAISTSPVSQERNSRQQSREHGRGIYTIHDSTPLNWVTSVGRHTYVGRD